MAKNRKPLSELEQLAYNKSSKQGKYKSKGIYVDGLYFHSVKEANYYKGLLVRKLAGEILKVERQVPLKITINGDLITTYVADFIVTMFDGTKQIIDVKSQFTKDMPLYKIKKKLLKSLYRIVITEV